MALIGTSRGSHVVRRRPRRSATTIYVDNMPFRVKGVLEPLGVSPHGDDQDNVIVVPVHRR